MRDFMDRGVSTLRQATLSRHCRRCNNGAARASSLESKHVETDLPIPKVAEAVGYSTPSYFIQVFRAEHDLTPAKYRRMLRDETI